MTEESIAEEQPHSSVVATVAGMATLYAAIATFVLVFFCTFHATQPVTSDAVTNLATDAPPWIWMLSTLTAVSVAWAVGKACTPLTSDDRPPR